MDKSYKDYLMLDPNISFPRPIIKGTGIAVQTILSCLARGKSKEEIMADFPMLSLEQIKACKSFAADMKVV